MVHALLCSSRTYTHTWKVISSSENSRLSHSQRMLVRENSQLQQQHRDPVVQQVAVMLLSSTLQKQHPFPPAAAA
jgi:hypothetical protein